MSYERPINWNITGRDAKDEKIKRLESDVARLVDALREARACIESMSFGDPVPGSWRERVDALLREYDKETQDAS